jgi:hypothetical protein
MDSASIVAFEIEAAFKQRDNKDFNIVINDAEVKLVYEKEKGFIRLRVSSYLFTENLTSIEKRSTATSISSTSKASSKREVHSLKMRASQTLRLRLRCCSRLVVLDPRLLYLQAIISYISSSRASGFLFLSLGIRRFVIA